MEELSQFIEKCISDGFNSPAEWCRVAREKLTELDVELQKIEKIKAAQANYRSFIKQLGGELKVKEVNSTFTSSDEEQLKEICDTVILYLTDKFENEINVQPRNIIDDTGIDSKLVFLAIKYLYDKGVITRAATAGREIIKGTNWNDDQ